jgi:hypothetical protein
MSTINILASYIDLKVFERGHEPESTFNFCESARARQ